MKIALVILNADPARGGAERYTADLATALARAGHEVALLSSSFVGQGPRGTELIELPTRGATRSGRYQTFLRGLGRFLARATYDIVHAMLPVQQCDVYHPHAGIAAGPAQKWNAVFNPRRRAMASVERDLLLGPRPPLVLSLSNYVTNDVARHYPTLPASRHATLLNGVDLSRFEPVAPRPSGAEVVALIVANDFARKGLAHAIQAVARLRDRRVKLVVVGRDDPSSYRSLATRLGAAVEFAGASTDVREWYSRSDFFVLPTCHDPCSLVVLEALASGLPVISTRFNGACEYMTSGLHGYVLDDPADIDALADAMRRLSDFRVRQTMAEACVALRPALSYEAHLEKLLAIYERAATGGRA